MAIDNAGLVERCRGRVASQKLARSNTLRQGEAVSYFPELQSTASLHRVRNENEQRAADH
jgi:hypothetical protein